MRDKENGYQHFLIQRNSKNEKIKLLNLMIKLSSANTDPKIKIWRKKNWHTISIPNPQLLLYVSFYVFVFHWFAQRKSKMEIVRFGMNTWALFQHKRFFKKKNWIVIRSGRNLCAKYYWFTLVQYCLHWWLKQITLFYTIRKLGEKGKKTFL